MEPSRVLLRLVLKVELVRGPAAPQTDTPLPLLPVKEKLILMCVGTARGNPLRTLGEVPRLRLGEGRGSAWGPVAEGSLGGVGGGNRVREAVGGRGLVCRWEAGQAGAAGLGPLPGPPAPALWALAPPGRGGPAVAPGSRPRPGRGFGLTLPMSLVFPAAAAGRRRTPGRPPRDTPWTREPCPVSAHGPPRFTRVSGHRPVSERGARGVLQGVSSGAAGTGLR